MYTYKLVWFVEKVSEDGEEIEYEETNVNIIKIETGTDDQYQVDTIKFGLVPDFEYFDKAILKVYDNDGKLVLMNELEIYRDGVVDIFDADISNNKISLEFCALSFSVLSCEVYHG